MPLLPSSPLPDFNTKAVCCTLFSGSHPDGAAICCRASWPYSARGVTDRPSALHTCVVTLKLPTLRLLQYLGVALGDKFWLYETAALQTWGGDANPINCTTHFLANLVVQQKDRFSIRNGSSHRLGRKRRQVGPWLCRHDPLCKQTVRH